MSKDVRRVGVGGDYHSPRAVGCQARQALSYRTCQHERTCRRPLCRSPAPRWAGGGGGGGEGKGDVPESHVVGRVCSGCCRQQDLSWSSSAGLSVSPSSQPVPSHSSAEHPEEPCSCGVRDDPRGQLGVVASVASGFLAPTETLGSRQAGARPLDEQVGGRHGWGRG